MRQDAVFSSQSGFRRMEIDSELDCVDRETENAQWRQEQCFVILSNERKTMKSQLEDAWLHRVFGCVAATQVDGGAATVVRTRHSCRVCVTSSLGSSWLPYALSLSRTQTVNAENM